MMKPVGLASTCARPVWMCSSRLVRTEDGPRNSDPRVDNITSDDLSCLYFGTEFPLGEVLEQLDAMEDIITRLADAAETGPDAKRVMFDRAIFKNDVRYRKKEMCRIERGGDGRVRVIDVEADEELLSLPADLTDEVVWEVFDWGGDAL